MRAVEWLNNLASKGAAGVVLGLKIHDIADRTGEWLFVFA